MKWKIALILSTFFLPIFLLFTPATQAQSILITLPPNSIPLGIVYDGIQTVWATGYIQGALFKIDIQTQTFQTYYVRGSPSFIGLYAITIDEDGNIWATERIAQKIAKFNPATNNFTEISLIGGETDSIIYHEGYIWVANMPYVTKIDPTTNQILQNYNLTGTPIWLKGDDKYIWVSKISEGNVSRFDTTTEQVTLELSGFDRPLGIETDQDNVYIAENTLTYGVTGQIAVYNKKTGQVTKVPTASVTAGGPSFVYQDTYSNLWWTDNSDHVGIIGATKKTYDATAPFQLFMTQVGKQMWFTADSYIITIDIPPPYIYQGDLILKDNINYTIANEQFDINGSILIKENATLNLNNAKLNFTQQQPNQFNMTLQYPANGNPRLQATNATITSTHPFNIYLHGNSTANTLNLYAPLTTIYAYDTAALTLTNSTHAALNAFNDAIIRVYWHLTIHVTNSTGHDQVSADVAVRDPAGSLVQSKKTNTQGKTSFILLEKTINSTNTYPISYYVITVTHSGNTYTQQVQMTQNREVTVTLIDQTAPIANAGPDQTVNEDTQVTFDGSASTDNVGIKTYTWTFVDVTTKTLSGKNPTYTFQTPKDYTVTLNVTDYDGNWNTNTVIIRVLDITNPTANAGQDRTANVGASINFDASASIDNVGIVNYHWDFGDGTTSEGVTAQHTYNSTGTYTVTLTVKDAANNTGTTTITITVVAPEAFPLWGVVVVAAVVAVLAIVLILKMRKK